MILRTSAPTVYARCAILHRKVRRLRRSGRHGDCESSTERCPRNRAKIRAFHLGITSPMASKRMTIMGTRHVVSAGHYLAAHAGFQILEAGGDAIDAGVATANAIDVLQT